MKRFANPLGLWLAVLLSEPCFADFASGTGFAVTTSKLVTNYHVVKGCSDVAVITSKGFRKAKVLAFDEDADLALLHSLGVSSAVAPLRQTEPLLGEWVGVFGFPLTGTLTSTGNFTDGVVSALRGISEDATNIQFTAPIQPGNSGGPLLDSSGNVIGVVVAKLNALKKAKETGDIPQNVNFAVSPDLLKAFLTENKVSFSLGNSTKTLGGEKIAAAAKDFTYRLMCEPNTGGNLASAPPPNSKRQPPDKPKQSEPPPPSPELNTPEQHDVPVIQGKKWHRDNIGEFITLRVLNDSNKVSYVENFQYMGPNSILETGPAIVFSLKQCIFMKTQSPAATYYGDGIWKDCADRRPFGPKPLTVVVELGSESQYFNFDSYQPAFIFLNRAPGIKKELEDGHLVKINIRNEYVSLRPEDGELFIRPVVLQNNAPKESESDRPPINPGQSTEEKIAREIEKERNKIARDIEMRRCSSFLDMHRRNSKASAYDASTYMAYLKRAISECFYEPEPFLARLRSQLKAAGKFRDLVGLSVKLDTSGEILSVNTHASSGMQAYDDALKNALWDASPLPLPANKKLFRGEFLIWFDLSTLNGR